MLCYFLNLSPRLCSSLSAFRYYLNVKRRREEQEVSPDVYSRRDYDRRCTVAPSDQQPPLSEWQYLGSFRFLEESDECADCRGTGFLRRHGSELSAAPLSGPRAGYELSFNANYVASCGIHH